MKQRSWFSVALIIVTIPIAILVIIGNQSVFANQKPLPPTIAPTATPGDPLPLPTTVSLAQPLTTKEQALEQLLRYDASIAIWSRPWSKDTMTLEPDRITIEAYPNIGAESAARGFKGEVPEVDANSGPVWVVTIKGDVAAIMSPFPNGSSVIYDGITYVISQITGNLLEVRTGPPKN